MSYVRGSQPVGRDPSGGRQTFPGGREIVFKKCKKKLIINKKKAKKATATLCARQERYAPPIAVSTEQGVSVHTSGQ